MPLIFWQTSLEGGRASGQTDEMAPDESNRTDEPPDMVNLPAIVRGPGVMTHSHGWSGTLR